MKSMMILLVLSTLVCAHTIITTFAAPDDNITGLHMGPYNSQDWVWALTEEGTIYGMDLTGTVVNSASLELPAGAECRGLGQYLSSYLAVEYFLPSENQVYVRVYYMSNYGYPPGCWNYVPGDTNAWGLCYAPGYGTIGAYFDGGSWYTRDVFPAGGSMYFGPVSVPFTSNYDIARMGLTSTYDIAVATPGDTLIRVFDQDGAYHNQYNVTTSTIPSAMGLARDIEDNRVWVSSPSNDTIYLLELEPEMALQQESWGAIKSQF